MVRASLTHEYACDVVAALRQSVRDVTLFCSTLQVKFNDRDELLELSQGTEQVRPILGAECLCGNWARVMHG